MTDTRVKHLSNFSDSQITTFLRSNYFSELSVHPRIEKLSSIDPEASYFGSEIVVVDRKYLVKEILLENINKSEKSLEAKSEVLRHLAQQGVPVLIPVRSLEGRSYAWISYEEEKDRHLVEVTEFYSNGEKCSKLESQIEEVGDAVGRVTKGLLSVPLELKQRVLARESRWQSFTNEKTGRDFREELREYREQVGTVGGELEEAIRNVLEPTIKEYERYTSEPAPEVPTGLVHQDIQEYNMIFDRSTKKLVAIIDWDSMEKRPRVYDAAYTLDRMAFIDPDRKTIHVDRAEKFLHAFSRHYQMSTKEEIAMFDVLINNTLRNVCGILRDVFQNGFKHPNYPYYLELLDVGRMRRLSKELFGETK